MASDGILVEGLGFAYGERTALTGVDLTVSPGEVVGLLGRLSASRWSSHQEHPKRFVHSLL